MRGTIIRLPNPLLRLPLVPQRVFCDACGAALYDGLELESPSEIILRYNGTCPKCQKSLSYEPNKVKILPYDEYLTRLKAGRKWGILESVLIRTVELVHRYDGLLPVRNIGRVLHLAGAR